ncbi:MAG: hypothetical protein HY052_03660 [Proteobacteria bacterium]|nr:hypothetical protein [Pseudomonadota bacterium]
MDNSKFSILEAVKNAYLFVGREWLYLLKVGSLPVILQIGTALFVQYQRTDASTTEAYLWGMPASLLFSWFMFLETRLLLLNERLDRLPPDRPYLTDRQISMKLSVITSLLFNMGLTGAMALLLALADSNKWGASTPATIGGLLLGGVIFWVGMGIVCLFPVALLFQFFINFLLSGPADISAPLKLTDTEQLAITIASAPLSLLLSALLNAAAAYALKQILGSRQNGVLA